MIATISLRVPEERSVTLAVADGVPADRMGIELLTIDLADLTHVEKRAIRTVLENVSHDTRAITTEFPKEVKVFDTAVGLTVESDEIQLLRNRIKKELADRSLEKVVQRRDESAPEFAISVMSNAMPTEFAEQVPPPKATTFAELMLISGDRIKIFPLAHKVEHEELAGSLVASAAEDVSGGRRFKIPVLVPEGIETGDKRIFEHMSLTTTDLPIPLQWQIKTGNGHDGSVIVGRIDSIERIDEGLGNAFGVFDDGPYGKEAQRLVDKKMLRGVSADLDQFERVEPPKGKKSKEAVSDTANELLRIKKGRVVSATLVSRPAFQECRIELIDDQDVPAVSDLPQDQEAIAACAMIASSIPVTPPAPWFENPSLDGPTPITVTDDGQVFGHIALWHVSHLGLPGNTRPPRSKTDYAYFKTGVVRTEEGTDVAVGQLTLSGGHADLTLSAQDAAAHYDQTNSALADVNAGEDAYGIWVAGALRPSATPEQIRVFRASSPSGDWRPIQGRLELVAVCQVNVPGFPVARARVASGHVTALVAAGAAAVSQITYPTMLDMQVAGRKQELVSKFHSMALEATEESLFRDFSQEKRDELAKSGAALSDGSYPIVTKQDLRNAVRAYGRTTADKKPAVKRHIMKRARALGATKMLPDTWSADVLELTAAEQRLRVQSLTASLRVKKKFREHEHPRDTEGKWRAKLAKLRSDVLGLEGAESERAAKALLKAEEAVAKGRLNDAEKHADDVDVITHRYESGALNRDTALREGFKAQADAMVDMPLPDPDEDGKFRFTDLPQAMQSMIRNMLAELEDQAGAEEVNETFAPLFTYLSGGDLATRAEIQAWMAQLTASLLAVRKSPSGQLER